MMWLVGVVSLVATSLATPVDYSFVQARSYKLMTKVENDHLMKAEISHLVDNLVISEESYQHVARLQNDSAMAHFIRRLLAAHGKAVNDEGALTGFVPWFSGTTATQSLRQMKKQLFEKPWVIKVPDRAIKDNNSEAALEPNRVGHTDSSLYSKNTGASTSKKKRKKTTTNVRATKAWIRDKFAKMQLKRTKALRNKSKVSDAKEDTILTQSPVGVNLRREELAGSDVTTPPHILSNNSFSSVPQASATAKYAEHVRGGAKSAAEEPNQWNAANKGTQLSGVNGQFHETSDTQKPSAQATIPKSNETSLKATLPKQLRVSLNLPAKNATQIPGTTAQFREAKNLQTASAQVSIPERNQASLKATKPDQFTKALNWSAKHGTQPSSGAAQFETNHLKQPSAQTNFSKLGQTFLEATEPKQLNVASNSSAKGGAQFSSKIAQFRERNHTETTSVQTKLSTLNQTGGEATEPNHLTSTAKDGQSVNTVQGWTPLATENLGDRSLSESQSQIATVIASKIDELKANMLMAGTNRRNTFKATRAMYELKLREQQKNTTILRETNRQIRTDIKALVLTNTELREQAKDLKKQSFAVREQLASVMSNFTLAQEFAARPLVAGSDSDVQFLKDLERNESEFVEAQSHASALASFDGISSVAFMQLGSDTDPADLLHTLQNTFSKLSEHETAAMQSLEQEFQERLARESRVQESVLAERRALLQKKQAQQALQSKLSGAVDHLKQLTKQLSDRLIHLRMYALRVSKQSS